MRRTLIFLGLLGGLLLLGLLTLPWTLGSILRLAGRSERLEFGRYERIGYGRFALHDIRFKREGFTITAERVEARAPLAFLWDQFQGSGETVLIENWEVQVLPPRSAGTSLPASAPGLRGWMPLRQTLDETLEKISDWLPPIKATEGRVVFRPDVVHISLATWERRRFRADQVTFRGAQYDLALDWPGGGELVFGVLPADPGLALTLRSTGPRIDLNVSFSGITGSGHAIFPDTGWIPQQAAFDADEVSIPAQFLLLGDGYERVTGTFNLRWSNPAGSIHMDAGAEPLPNTALPALQAKVDASMDAERIQIAELRINAPGLLATLNEPLVIGRDGKLRSAVSRFDVQALLSEMPWFEAEGAFSGELVVTPGPDGRPLVEGVLDGRQIKYQQITAQRVRLPLSYAWPRIRLHGAELALAGTDVASLQGAYDLTRRELVDVAVQGRLSPASVAAWQPQDLAFGDIEFDARANGPASSLRHEGRIRIRDLATDVIQPLEAVLAWTGTGAEPRVTATFAREQAQLTLEAQVREAGVTVETFRLDKGPVEQWRTRSPFVMTWSPQLSVADLALEGPAGRLTLSYAGGPVGQIGLEAQDLQPSLLEPWIQLEGPKWKLGQLVARGQWDQSPVELALTASGELETAEGQYAQVALDGRLQRDRSIIHQASITYRNEDIVRASGQMPLTLRLHPSPKIGFKRDAPLRLDFRMEQSPGFWGRVADWTGFRLQNPDVSMNVEGSWQALRGNAQIRATRVELNRDDAAHLPPLEQFEAVLSGTGRDVVLERLHGRVAGQLVEAAGRVALPNNRGLRYWGEREFWKTLPFDGRIDLPDVDLAAWAPYAPRLLAPAGRLRANLEFHPGGQLGGSLSVRDAISRPLGPLGILHNIQAEIALDGRQIAVREISAHAAGQPVILQGTADLNELDRPKLNLTMKGKNLPFARQAGLLVRGDLDLQVVTDPENNTVIRGRTRLRDSLFLSDVRALIPRGGPRSAPARRPPYFSIETEPLARWLLDVRVEGERFLRLRTPLFSGLASARFQLLGSLREPRAIGEALIDEGQVSLPFASLRVEQGSVRLTEAEPYEPQLTVMASGRRIGYDLRMELTGPASSPNLVFSSSPPLESEQVLLLVMAGEAPQDEVSYSGRQRAIQIGRYLGQSLLDRFGGDPNQAERFTLTSGERVSRQGRETYTLEVPVAERWSLVGEYDEFDAYNLGVKWRAFVHRPEEDEDPPDERDEADQEKPTEGGSP